MQNQKRRGNFLGWKDAVLYSAKLILNFNTSLKKKKKRLGLVTHTYNLSTWVKSRSRRIFKFKTSLLYKVRSRRARATQ